MTVSFTRALTATHTRGTATAVPERIFHPADQRVEFRFAGERMLAGRETRAREGVKIPLMAGPMTS